jgi:hypothetical protein
MEAAITNEFLKNIQTATQRFVTLVARDRGQTVPMAEYLQEVDLETRQFTAAIQAVRGVSKSACACDPSRQLQKTVSGLSEDIGDLDSRLALLERERREEGPSPWNSSPEFEFLSEGLQNEVVEIEVPENNNNNTTVRNIVVHLDEADEGMGIPVKDTTAAPVAPVAPVASVVAPVVAPANLEEEEPEEEPEDEDEDEDEEEALELDEFTHNGTAYYKDPDNNVYTVNEDGEVDDTPIGRWLEKRQTIKLYTTA